MQALNRWLLDVQSVLNSSGNIDPTTVEGLLEITQTIEETAGEVTVLSNEVSALTNRVSTAEGNITTLTMEVTTLQGNAVSRNGSGAPSNALGAVGDWYADTSNLHIYVKTGAAAWTKIV